MNSFLKLGLRSCLSKLQQSTKLVVKPMLSQRNSTPAYSRTLWHMCSTSKINHDFLITKPHSKLCDCGCKGFAHTGGEKEIIEFLQGEIAEEKKVQKMKMLPAELDGFVVSSDEADLTFEKKLGDETITISMNVNHSVDTEGISEDGSYSDEMKAKPSFEVDIVKNDKTLNFACSFVQFEEPNESGVGDIFEINEITYFEGEYKDKTYSVSADLLDENLYDVFMAILNQKGISMQFMESVSEIATFHEHSLYINLLENMRKFFTVEKLRN